MKKYFLVLFLQFTFFQIGLTCSCNKFPAFYNNTTVRDFGKNCVTVLDSLSFHYQYEGLIAETGHFTIIDTLTNLKINIGEPIVVYGQDGLNCGYSVHNLTVRDTYLLSLFDGFYKQVEDDTFYLDGCGDFFLNLSEPQNQGWNIEDLKTKVSGIIISNLKTIPLSQAILVFPNPTSEKINIVSKDFSIQNIKLFDSLGRIIQTLNGIETNEQEVIVSQYQVGIYYLQIFSEKGMIYKKFIKK